MINLNIDLLELNDLYYAVGKHRIACEEQLKEYGNSDYFVKQLERAKEVESKIQDALYDKVNKLQEAIDYIDEVVEKYENEDTIAERREDAKHEKAFSHFVDNDEADEDAKGPTLYYRPQTKSKFNGVSQAILDMVERQGWASWSEMNNYYRKVTGSNTFHAILKALMTPYKNRKTRRYIKKVGRGTYVVDYADQYNWVVNDDYNYND